MHTNNEFALRSKTASARASLKRDFRRHATYKTRRIKEIITIEPEFMAENRKKPINNVNLIAPHTYTLMIRLTFMTDCSRTLAIKTATPSRIWRQTNELYQNMRKTKNERDDSYINSLSRRRRRRSSTPVIDFGNKQVFVKNLTLPPLSFPLLNLTRTKSRFVIGNFTVKLT